MIGKVVLWSNGIKGINRLQMYNIRTVCFMLSLSSSLSVVSRPKVSMNCLNRGYVLFIINKVCMKYHLNVELLKFSWCIGKKYFVILLTIFQRQSHHICNNVIHCKYFKRERLSSSVGNISKKTQYLSNIGSQYNEYKHQNICN